MRCCLGNALLLALASTAPCQSKPYAPAVNPSSEKCGQFHDRGHDARGSGRSKGRYKGSARDQVINGKALMHHARIQRAVHCGSAEHSFTSSLLALPRVRRVTRFIPRHC